MMRIEFDTIEELQELLAYLGTLSEKKTSKTRSEINHQNYLNRKEKSLKQSENGLNSDKEEERKEEEVLPLSSPSSLLSSPSDSPNIYPITPYNPPLPEEEKREEEKIISGKRVDLMHFGAYVQLTPKEYKSLEKKFGEVKTDQMIQNMNRYIGEDPKRQKVYATRNHYLTLLNWERRNEEQSKPKVIVQEKPKSKSFGDMLKEMQEEQKWDIEI